MKKFGRGPLRLNEGHLQSSAGAIAASTVERETDKNTPIRKPDNALYMLNISPEDEAKFPEAVRCIREIAASLGPHGESKALREEVEKEVAEVKELSYKVKEKELILEAIKGIIVEQQTSGNYSRFSEGFIKTLSNTMTLSNLQLKYEGIGNLFGLEHEFSKLADQHLESHPEMPELLKAIEETYANVPDVIGLTKELNASKQELLSVLMDYRAVKTEVSVVQKDIDDMIVILSSTKKQESELNEKKLEVMEKKKKIELLKTKISQLDVDIELYGGEKGEAYKILLEKTQQEIQELKEKNKQLEEKLKLYASLPQDKFLPILEEYKKIKKDVENAKWSLEKLHTDSD